MDPKKETCQYFSDLQKILEIEDNGIKGQDIEIMKLRKKNKELKKKMFEVKRILDDLTISKEKRATLIAKLINSS